MKKTIPFIIAGVLAIAAGVLVKPASRIACICLIFGGLIIALGSIGYWALTQTEKRCLACGQRIYVSVGQHDRVRSGMIACPRCGALVRVDHVSPR